MDAWRPPRHGGSYSTDASVTPSRRPIRRFATHFLPGADLLGRLRFAGGPCKEERDAHSLPLPEPVRLGLCVCYSQSCTCAPRAIVYKSICPLVFRHSRLALLPCKKFRVDIYSYYAIFFLNVIPY
jgi:hypothetical protein